MTFKLKCRQSFMEQHIDPKHKLDVLFTEYELSN